MKMSEQWILDKKYLEPIQNTALFYPCSGNDLLIPIELFSPYITDYWFVDKGYFTPGHQDTKHDKLDLPADQHQPLLLDDERYTLQNTSIQGQPSWHYRHSKDIEPCILTETYMHQESGRTIRIHKRRGYGFSGFRTEHFQLGVFFYRGDSQGEGGSGNLWLNDEHIDEICNRLIPHGLLALDGSDGSPFYRKQGTYQEWWKYYRHPPCYTPEEFIQNARPFSDRKGRHFACVGYAGEKYCPTMIWQMQ
ncbi:hypothetical protein [Candidatus Symbiobacter mobilis]|uniref:Uncharacterized protein n=1 Tax=Candidatus Symbiobacter mobilis CR TaxID=946483 RepID=U5NA94_9BURK|nr:hypothetical protein [Candidatus Symbiobacter mobilis]AGX88322.1 hypothetical protein Cenrod_2258 [Candidatus Symbiobacter mobilis CR]